MDLCSVLEVNSIFLNNTMIYDLFATGDLLHHIADDILQFWKLPNINIQFSEVKQYIM